MSARSLILVCLLIFMFPTKSRAQSVADIQIKTLKFDSGLQVVFARTPPFPGRTPRVYVGTYVGYGTNYERAVGHAHFIEHLVANGKPLIELPVVPVAAQTYASNAVTRANTTVFIRTVSPDALETSIYSRLARIGKVQIDAVLFEKEKTRVIEELERVRANARFGAYKALDAMSKGRPPAVDDEIREVRSSTLESIGAEISAAYQPAHSVLVIAGDFDPTQGMQIVRKAVDALNLGVRPSDANSRKPPAKLRRADDVSVAQNNSAISAAGIGFHQPPHNSKDYPAFLVADQLLMGGREIEGDVALITRSDQSSLGTRLASALGASGFWDGKEQRWGVPVAAERDPSIYAILFSLPLNADFLKVRAAITKALKNIRREEMSSRQIIAARDKLAAFYDMWLLESDYRILGDHLAAFAIDGADPSAVKNLPQRIRATSTREVQRMFDQVLLGQQPWIAVMKPSCPRPECP